MKADYIVGDLRKFLRAFHHKSLTKSLGSGCSTWTWLASSHCPESARVPGQKEQLFPHPTYLPYWLFQVPTQKRELVSTDFIPGLVQDEVEGSSECWSKMTLPGLSREVARALQKVSKNQWGCMEKSWKMHLLRTETIFKSFVFCSWFWTPEYEEWLCKFISHRSTLTRCSTAS